MTRCQRLRWRTETERNAHLRVYTRITDKNLAAQKMILKRRKHVWLPMRNDHKSTIFRCFGICSTCLPFDLSCLHKPELLSSFSRQFFRLWIVANDECGKQYICIPLEQLGAKNIHITEWKHELCFFFHKLLFPLEGILFAVTSWVIRHSECATEDSWAIRSTHICWRKLQMICRLRLCCSFPTYFRKFTSTGWKYTFHRWWRFMSSPRSSFALVITSANLGLNLLSLTAQWACCCTFSCTRCCVLSELQTISISNLRFTRKQIFSCFFGKWFGLAVWVFISHLSLL